MPRRKARDPVIRATDGLIARIRDLNQQTKHERDVYARELLYREKNSLQSDLLRQWGEHFEVLPDPEQPGTVSLTRRADGRDACHARLDQLDSDVRAWLKTLS